MSPNEQTELGGEPNALRAILYPGGPDSVALEALQKAKTATAEQLREALAKRQATAQARAALAGITLHALAGDDGRPEFIATRWAMTKSFSDIADVERWLDLVGAPG